jgi:uncharacterized membrane protein
MTATAFYELVVAPLVFALLARHARRALGAGRAAVEVLALVGYGFAVERASMSLFSSHEYGSGWRIVPFGVPLAVTLVWASLILAGLALASRLSLRSPLARAAAATLLGLSLDLVMEPVAVAEGLWRWTPAGGWLAVPLGNYVGWAVIVGIYAWGAERFSARGSLLRQGTWRALLALLALGVLVAVGLLWRRLGVEGLLPPEAGWILWGVVCLATLSLALRSRWSALGTSLGSRLGVVPGHGPGLVFLISGAAFVTHAMLVDSGGVRLAALGPAVALLVVAGGDIHHAALASWRERMHGRLAGTSSLVAVLMKRPNGQPWTREERAFLQSELRAMARYLPALLLFLLPGSVVLLPLYAFLLDRRRGARKAEAARSLVGPSSGRPSPGRGTSDRR